MIIHDVKQGSDEWLRLRAGKVTASECGVLVTAGGKVATGEGVTSYLALKLAERWMGRPLDRGYLGRSADQGTVLEPEAIAYFELERDVKTKRVGFVTDDAKSIGCSPDIMFADDSSGVEIKSPEPHTHCRYLIEGGLPEKYKAQVQFSMLVTGADVWHFMSYRRGFPPLIVEVERDWKYIATMLQAVQAFECRLEMSFEDLMRANGGPPEPMPEEADQIAAYFAEGE